MSRARGDIEFVGGPLCGKVVRGFVGEPVAVSDWWQGDAVQYLRRDSSTSSALEARPLVSAVGNRMYEFVR